MFWTFGISCSTVDELRWPAPLHHSVQDTRSPTTTHIRHRSRCHHDGECHLSWRGMSTGKSNVFILCASDNMRHSEVFTARLTHMVRLSVFVNGCAWAHDWERERTICVWSLIIHYTVHFKKCLYTATIYK